MPNAFSFDPTRPLCTAELMPQYEHHNLQAIQRLASAEPLDIAVDRFIFLRHGQTKGNLTRVFQPADISLNDNGLAQAERAAGMLKGVPIDQIFASTMLRAQQTAQAVGRATGKTPTPEPRLQERWFGDLIGTSSLDLNWGFDPPNGETLADFVARVRDGVRERLNQDPSRSTLLVAHGGVMYALAFSLRAIIQPVFIENATPLQFDRVDGRWIVTPLGRQDSNLGASGV